MKSKNILSATAAAFFLCAGFAHASDGTFNFVGALSSATCTITNSGGADISVFLPAISKNSLPTAGAVAGKTFFTIDIGQCADATSVNVYFDGGADIDSGTGNLKNISSSGTVATNVQTQILTEAGTKIVPGDSSQAQASAVTGTSGKFTYIAQYVAVGAAAIAGGVDSRVYYTLQYQ